MGDDDLVARGHRGDALGSRPDVGPLILRGHRLPALQQRVAAESDHDAHGDPCSAQRGHEDRLDGVHPVLGLLEGDVGRALEDILGDLDAVGEVRVLRGDLGADLGLASCGTRAGSA